MKIFLFTVCFLLNIYVVFAQQGGDSDKAIRSIVKNQELAWKTHDLDAFCSAFSDDATLINFIGIFWTGKPEILDNLHKINEDIFKHTSIKMPLKKIRSITPECINCIY